MNNEIILDERAIEQVKKVVGGNDGNAVAILIGGNGYGELKAFDGETEIEITFVEDLNDGDDGLFTANVPLNKEIRFEYTPLNTFDGVTLNSQDLTSGVESGVVIFNCTFTIGGMLYIQDYVIS